MHIKDKLAEAERTGKPKFSFEYFPPKTQQVCCVECSLRFRSTNEFRESEIFMTVRLVCAVLNITALLMLFQGMNRMHDLGPAFVDVTWGAGGQLSDLTCEMVHVAQTEYGLETCMHLTCTDMPQAKVDRALKEAYKAGCSNILALRGDPPRDQDEWKAVEGGFRYAKDLIKHIKSKYGNHFDVGVAGYPEGLSSDEDPDTLMDHLKDKVDAGGSFIVTQMFYDVDLFLNWVAKVRTKGITVPIIPGIMPIQTYGSFLRRVKWSNCKVPQAWTDALEPVKNDDAVVREVGKDLVTEMCRRLLSAGILHLHLLAYLCSLLLYHLTTISQLYNEPSKVHRNGP